MLLLSVVAAFASAPWMDTSLSPATRAEKLLAVLSTSEKIAMTYATHTSSSHAKQHSATGIGAVKYMSAFSCSPDRPHDCIEQRNELQRLFLQKSAHGIPISFINEGLHGGASGGCIFPEPITQSMAWNRTLVSQIGAAIAAEASAIGVDTVFAPVVNMMPDARFGRLQEGYGENPTVAATLGGAAVAGLQGFQNGPQRYTLRGKVASLGKHFAAYGAAEGGLNGGPADITNRTLHEVYLRPWLALAHAGVRAVMPAHQTVHDVPCHANAWLMQTLRDGMGFGAGVALSDCNDVGQTYHARMAANRSHAAALALHAGVDWDLQCGTDPEEWGYGNGYLAAALDEGLVSPDALDATTGRVLQQKFAARLFDEPYTDTQGVNQKLDTPAHRALAREAAEQGVVLLQNTNSTLPLGTLAGKTVAVIGPLTNDTTALVGSYVLSGAHVVTVPEALASLGANVHTEVGCASSGNPDAACSAEGLRRATQLASTADVTVLVLGDGNGECGEWDDRDSLEMGGGQLPLLRAVAAAATGEEGGTAIVRILTGAVNPSGKLTQSWPRTVGHVGGSGAPWLQRVRGKWVANHKGCTSATSRCFDGYADSRYDATPLFAFGFGMSYTRFTYRALRVSPLVPGETMLGAAGYRSPLVGKPVWNVSVDISNEGNVEGTEVVQLYVQDPAGHGPFVPYWRRLVAFDRIRCGVGEVCSCALSVAWEHFAQFDGEMRLRVLPGSYIMFAGGSAEDTPVQAAVVV